MELAAGEGRVLVTWNSRDFAPILREWAEAGHDHAGAILIWTLGHESSPPSSRESSVSSASGPLRSTGAESRF